MKNRDFHLHLIAAHTCILRCGNDKGSVSPVVAWRRNEKALFNHLVGGGEERRGDGQLHRLCRLQVQNQLELRDLLDR